MDYRCHRATDSEAREAAAAMEEIGLQSSRVIVAKNKNKNQIKKVDPKKTQKKAYRTLAKFVRQYRRSSKKNNNA